jgi:hypothetical protein
MQVRPASFLILLVAISAPALAAAQSVWGAPAEGVQVQSRFSNPGQSQSILTAAPPAPAAAPAPAPAAGAPAAGAAEGAPQPFFNDRVTVGGGSDGSDLGAGDGDLQPIAATLIYQGVIPGRSPGASGTGKTNALNWIGFQPLDLVTRVFVRTDHDAPFEVIAAPDGLSVTVRLKVPAIAHRNLGRTIDTSAFGRDVAAIDTRRGPDGTTDVVISMLSPAQFVTEAREGYLYVDFAR